MLYCTHTDRKGIDMSYYVERMVNGRAEWLRIRPEGEMWVGSFCLVGDLPQEHRPN